MKSLVDQPCVGADDLDFGGRSFSRRAWAHHACRAAIAFHITMRLVTGTVIAGGPAALRTGARILLRHGKKRGMLAFRFADTHLHVLAIGDRKLAGKLALYVESALRSVLGIPVPFEAARIRPIHDQRHLLNALRYIFRQEDHHGTSFDPAHDGSSLPDLLGLRVGASWLEPRLLAVLPRLTREMLLEWLDAPALSSQAVVLVHLRDAAAAAFGVSDLAGTTVAHIRARRTAVHQLRRRAPDASAVTALGIRARAAARYEREAADDAAIRAVELQLRLRTLIAERASSLSLVSNAEQPSEKH